VFFLGAASLVLCAGVATAQSNNFADLLGLKGKGAGSAEPPKVEVTVSPAEAQPGDEVRLAVTVKLPPESYTYSMSRKFGGATKITFAPLAGLEAVGEFEADHPPKTAFEPLFNQELEKYHDQVTWTQKFRVLPEAAGRQLELTGKLDYQVCDKANCTPLKVNLSATLTVGGTPQTATTSEPFFFEARPGKAGKPQPLTLQVRLVPSDPQPGGEATLEVTAVLEEGWHIYATTQKPDNSGVAAEINLTQIEGLKPLADEFTPDRPPEITHPEPDIEHQSFHERVTWSRKFEVLPDAKPEQIHLAGEFTYQVCTEAKCLNPTTVEFQLEQKSAAPPAQAAAPAEALGTALANAPAAIAAAADPRAQGLVYFLGAAFLAGLAALLTPCVFPMIPITVSFFLKQAEKQHHRPLPMALAYCGSIILTFTVLGLVMSFLFGATSITAFANGVFLNLFLFTVLVFFGFNLLGMYEIRIPSWLLTYTAGKESVGGYAGVLFMALTFTLTSFTCTFAFLGLILVWASNGQFWWPITGLLAFSTAFALPFFLLAIFPSYLKKLPKSGGWMNSVKVVMGLVELAFAFKFISVADVAWHGQPTLFDYHLVMSAWMIIALTAGAYLLGLFRLPHDTPSDHIGVLPLATAMSFLGLASYLSVGLVGNEKPNGWLWGNIAAFAPPSIEVGDGLDGPFLVGADDQLTYLLDFQRGIEVARKQNQPVFLDFTGVNCINCRKMEKRMAAPAIKGRLARLLRMRLYTDVIPNIGDEPLAKKLLASNNELQSQWFGDTTLPAYAVVAPDGKTILSRYSGLEQREGEFVEFLDAGLRGWETYAAQHPPGKVPAAMLAGQAMGK
jgi:thiol:disulfide interchange protein DsbD